MRLELRIDGFSIENQDIYEFVILCHEQLVKLQTYHLCSLDKKSKDFYYFLLC